MNLPQTGALWKCCRLDALLGAAPGADSTPPRDPTLNPTTPLWRQLTPTHAAIAAGLLIAASLVSVVVAAISDLTADEADGTSTGEQSPQAPLVTEGMILIPAGDAITGSTDKDKDALDDEKPAQRVNVDAFWIDKHEVTVAEYRACVEAKGGGCSAPWTPGRSGIGPRPLECSGSTNTWIDIGKERHPVNCVDWHQATAFCAWKRKRLPTEAEWEKAARGGCDAHEGDCATQTPIYPWGNERPTCDRAQFNGCSSGTVEVGLKPAGQSPYGAMDLSGNVWEWTSSCYDRDATKAPGASAEAALACLKSNRDRVVKGGSFDYYAPGGRAADRDYRAIDSRNDNLGFRCALSAQPSP